MNVDEIRIKRVVKKMTQRELAEKAGINRAYISLIESGKHEPSISVLSRIAKALDCNVKDFF
jgi:transcriptional regulator with XRE-family HTH domain